MSTADEWASARYINGTVKAGQPITYINRPGGCSPGKLAQIYVYEGLNARRAGVDFRGRDHRRHRPAGDSYRRDDLRARQPDPLPITIIDEPTLRMTFGVNTSPFSGKEGQFSTSRKLRERL